MTPPHENRFLLSPDLVGHPTAWERKKVHEEGVQSVDGGSRLDIQLHARVGPGRCCRHEQDEQGAHAIVAEPLPHLGEEERGQAAWMAKKVPPGAVAAWDIVCMRENGRERR